MRESVKRMEKYATEHLSNQALKMRVEDTAELNVDKEKGGKDGNVFENT